MTSAAEDHDLAFARLLAERVIDQMGSAAPPMGIIRLGYHHGFDEDRFEVILSEDPSEDILIEVGIGDARDPDHERQGAYFTVGAPHEEAVAATATGLQEHVLEYTHGAPLPPCPDHRHPLQASVVDGLASWVCPIDPTHHVEPILPPSMRSRFILQP